MVHTFAHFLKFLVFYIFLASVFKTVVIMNRRKTNRRKQRATSFNQTVVSEH